MNPALIKTLLAIGDLSMGELARKLGVSRTAVSLYLNDRRADEPTLKRETLIRLRRVLLAEVEAKAFGDSMTFEDSVETSNGLGGDRDRDRLKVNP